MYYKNPKGQVPEIGDWVRFYQCGKLVIGCVQYIGDNAIYSPYSKQLQTDIGIVTVSDVLEARPVAPESVGMEQKKDHQRNCYRRIELAAYNRGYDDGFAQAKLDLTGK